MSKFVLVTLGCFRNEVESDNLRSVLRGMKHVETGSLEDADFIIVNSCGFIAEACDEGIDTILELAEISSNLERPVPIIVAGCMAQRYGIELMNEMPEISAVMGVDWGQNIEQIISSVVSGRKYLDEPGVPRFTDIRRSVDSSETASLFVRISDGCDRRCNFCTIPSIRGSYVSRNAEDILSEIGELAASRKREVVLVGQDLTCYGKDLKGGTTLAKLVRDISKIKNVHWIRLLYLQPEGLTGELVEEITSNPSVCNYFDIPFQHASGKIIKTMGRSGDADSYKGTISSIRNKAPGAALRTTVMVGFPGEGEKEFEELTEFVCDVGFDWLGVFRFSPEEGTRAAEFAGQVSHEVSLKRYNRLLEIQESIEESKSTELLGRVMEVMIEDRCAVEGYGYVGRSYREAPVVDGSIYLLENPALQLEPGTFVDAKITGQEGLDLAGEILESNT